MKTFSPTLLSWYHRHKRDLPWRHTKDPYKIWLCEIIMQQTRIVQGLAYYNRFVETFPSPLSLARASEDQVLRLWQGLGYYSRARNLHAAAKSMNGKFPTTYEGVRALKGVGDYTAAAICSIAYNMPYAVVDGNVYRVLSRVFDIHTPIDSSEGKKQFTALAQQLLDKRNPGDFNQAMMDFGALICTPQSPQCAQCPLRTHCQAFEKKIQAQLPIKGLKTKVTTRYFHYIYVEQGKYTWIAKRGAGDIWQNLYEVPLLEGKNENLPVKHVPAWFGTAKLVPIGKPVKHVLSHQIIYAYIYKVKVPLTRKVPNEFKKIPADSLSQYAVSRLMQKLLEQI